MKIKLNSVSALAVIALTTSLTSTLIFAGTTTGGLPNPSAPILLQPRYQQTTVTNERVGVKNNEVKTIIFSVHALTGDTAGGFKVNFATTTDVQATVTGSAVLANSSTVAATCSATLCTFPNGTRTAKLNITGSQSGFSYKTYSSTYYQGCDASTGRYCGTLVTYPDYSAAFSLNVTEEKVGTIYQGDFDIFNNIQTGDIATLHVSSTSAITTNLPTLRVRATQGASATEFQIGHRYPCTKTDTTNKEWDCAIPEGDAVPDLSQYSNARLVFSSSRNNANATLTIKNARKNTNVLVCQ